MKRRLLSAAVLALATAPGLGAKEAPRHLIYLHGRIVQEEQSARPKHAEWGHYELEEILATLRQRGFVVTGEIRPKATTVSAAADRVVGQVRDLLAAGVPADRITIVGGSMGASIAMAASARLGNRDLRFCILGACLSANVRGVLEEEATPAMGRLLAVRDESDALAQPCPAWSEEMAKEHAPLVAREIVVSTGLGHGFLYRPLPEWVDPVVAWAVAP